MTSCFDIVEEIDLKSNGSGAIKVTVNLSKSRTKVSSLMKLDKVDGLKIPSERDIRSEISKITTTLKKTNGISNVHSSLDFTNYIAVVSCDFRNINALNTFVKTLSAQFKTSLSDYSIYSYDAKSKTLSRTYKYNSAGQKELNKLKPENQKSLQNAYFTYIYRFEHTVATQKNSLAKVSSNKKAVMLKANVLDIVNGKANLSNTITLN
ncbi:hypothetical protein [Sphingobacterium rhinopitheci]|uniref:hypothetical protein n=1 Tax=Sphingobacterium rhinopitheci TaxID=2781960 RepID=UPI001F529950|nr:hypothetical protein [Sphingobacterium rhinopitheci]